MSWEEARTEDAFLKSIREHPHDETCRLVFADWLEEHREPGYADFIRAHCQLARLPETSPNRPTALAAAKEAAQQALRPICARPDDDAPRLIYAAMLELSSDPDERIRAEFIRLQCLYAHEVDNLSKLPPRRRLAAEDSLQRLETQILIMENKHPEWEEVLNDLGGTAVVFQRGFPAIMSISVEKFLEHGAKLFALAPITEVCIERRPGMDMAQLANCEHLLQVKSLKIEVGAAEVQTLTQSPRLCNLTSLHLKGKIGDAGAEAVAKSPHLANLKELHLAAQDITDSGVRTLATSPHLKQIESLSLFLNSVGDAGVETLAQHFGSLKELNLGFNKLTDACAGSLLRLDSLEELSIGNNQMSVAAFDQLADGLNKLKCLSIGNNTDHLRERRYKEWAANRTK